MTLSRYTYLFEKEKRYFAFLCISNACVEISQRLYRLFRYSVDIPLEKVEQNDTLNNLKRLKIISTNFDDDLFYDSLKLKYLNRSFQTTHLSLTILPTQDCNLVCPYCFEGEKQRLSMNGRVEDAILRFINDIEAKSISLTWFGGEPMLRPKVISRILNKLKELESIKVVGHSMISNCTLLKGNIEETFREIPLKSLQVTLDGEETTHNNIRQFPNGKGTYNLIKEQLLYFHSIYPNTRISIRVNLSKNNVDQFEQIFQEVNDWFKDLDVKYNIYPGFIREYKDVESKFNCLDRNEQSLFYQNLHRKGISYFSMPRIKLGGCGATSYMNFVIGADGKLYKCWEDVGKREFVIGNIEDFKIWNRSILTSYILRGSKFSNDSCKMCTFFPICDGGCPKQRLEARDEKERAQLCTLYAMNEGLILHSVLEEKYNCKL